MCEAEARRRDTVVLEVGRNVFVMRVRALALLWNFCPSSPGTVRKYHGQACPAERLNGKRYAENWLENLLISGSMNGVEMDQQIPL